jgi:L,D-transpeptidase YcbB
MRPYLERNINTTNIQLQYPYAVKEFYEISSYRFFWMQSENGGNRDLLLTMLENAGIQGLHEKAYQYKFIEAFRNQTFSLDNTEDSMAAEIKFTDAAIHFFSNLAFGGKPALSYYGLDYSPSCVSIPSLLSNYLSANSLATLPDHFNSQFPEIKRILAKINWFIQITSDSGMKDEQIVSNRATIENKPLIKKLFFLGIIDSLGKKITEKEIKDKIQEAQRGFNLLADGVLRSTTLKELNVPLTTRLEQLNFSINYYRWLFCLTTQESVIVVNIPAASLKVYHYGVVINEMRLIVGKPSTPTPTLSSKISEVILYPYWMVPYNIATKELLPSIKRNPGYLTLNNFQVLNANGKVVNPYSINWKALGPSYFPYFIRQSTGCDNSLGVLKLNFYNPFSVYLHDTPNKNLFMLNRRYFSHGCMRMEKPMELGHMVLQDNGIAIDTLEEKGCLRNQSPVIVPASRQMPVIVWYNPAGIDSTGRVIFYEDVYRKFNW